MARDRATAVTGTRVLGGRYALQEVLGTGGMATVWRARDEVLGRDVAVKVLSPQYAADPGFLARFEREARHAARLSHPHLVTVFDCGVDQTMPFIVMELVTGPTPRQILDQAGTLPAGEAVSIAAAVCEALDVAHAAGLVHRDIKPANIVLAAGGEVKVLDFGIARADGGGTTRTQAVLGTPAYLSPEQASGQAAGPQTDLSSLGCVLFEMLTGAPPFSPTPQSAWPTGTCTTSPARRRPGVPACPGGSTRTPPGCWRRTPPTGRPAPLLPAPGCWPRSTGTQPPSCRRWPVTRRRACLQATGAGVLALPRSCSPSPWRPRSPAWPPCC